MNQDLSVYLVHINFCCAFSATVAGINSSCDPEHRMLSVTPSEHGVILLRTHKENRRHDSSTKEDNARAFVVVVVGAYDFHAYLTIE